MGRFNPRARVGRDVALVDEYLVKDVVSIHAPAWGATWQTRGSRNQSEFQSTRPRGARHSTSLSICSPSFCFNPRARVGRDRPASPRINLHWVFQSTRPRGARRVDDLCLSQHLRVSIHAPAWGATVDDLCLSQHLRVSIHAPAWGATVMPATPSTTSTFQSTRPRGARRGRGQHRWRKRRFQSTRPRGARPLIFVCCLISSGFNPRARVGRDTTIFTSRVSTNRFQSTRPRGARQKGFWI